MKHLLYLIVLAGLVFPVRAEGEKEVIPYYFIRARVKDAAIPADRSVARFTIGGDNLPTAPLTLLWSVDGKEHKQVLNKHTFDVTLPKGEHIFQFFLTENHVEIYTGTIEFDGSERVEIDLYFVYSETQIMVEKPVIYLYPEQQQNVSVRVSPAGKLGFTYPAYDNGWNITANTDGTLTHNGKTYPYLFWDAETPFSALEMGSYSGFIVEKERVVPFLEEQLTAIGLNAQEQTDFITYWGPRLVASDKVFLQFVWGEAANRFASLEITPQPDHVHRLYLVWSTMDATASFPELAPQQLPVFDRSGFDVLEWGGTQLSTSAVSMTLTATDE